jgi:hypothetical protein
LYRDALVVGQQAVGEYFYSVLRGPIIVGGYPARGSSFLLWSSTLTQTDLQTVYFLNQVSSFDSLLLWWTVLDEGRLLVLSSNDTLVSTGNKQRTRQERNILVGCTQNQVFASTETEDTRATAEMDGGRDGALTIEREASTCVEVDGGADAERAIEAGS